MLKRFGVAVTIFILTGLSLSDRVCAQSPAYTDEGIPEHTVAIPVPLGFVGATTGALHLEIPISTIPQRNGEPIVTKLIYDSTFYHYGCAQSAVWCAHGSSWRVISGSRRSGRTDYDDTQTGCFDSGFPIGHVDTYTNFRFIDIDGTAHVADNPSIYTRYFDCYSTSGSKDPNPGISAVSGTFSDRSGYTFQVTNFLKTRVWANDGTLVADGTGASCIPKDTNGNCGNNTFPISAVTFDSFASSGCPLSTSGAAHIFVKVSDGSTATYTLNCTAQNVSDGTSPVGTFSFLTSLALPDGSQYGFGYDTGNTGIHPGTLSNVTLRTGGQASFTYTAPSNLVNTASFGGGTWNFTYNSGYCPGCSSVTTVTGPPRYDAVSKTNVNDKTVYTTVPNSSFLSTAQYYSGSSTLIKTISINYLGISSTPASVATTLNDSNQTSQKFYQYLNGWRDHLSQKQETDYSGTIVRTTKISYNGPYAKISSIGVYAGNGSGSPVSSMSYSYDEYGANYCKNSIPMLSNFVGASGHDDANYGVTFSARGNITSINRLISGNTWALSHRCYDTLGNVTQEVDSGGYPTTYDYSDNWADSVCVPGGTLTHGFPTTVTDALGYRHRSAYYSCTVTPQTQTDENDLRASRVGTTYTYDFFGRPLTVKFPDGGQTTNTYPSVVTASTTKTTGTGSVRTAMVLDSFGRVIQNQLNSDPDCAGGNLVDTTYDAFGRSHSESNPYCNQNDPTYGLTLYAYDVLGRVAQVTHPDGSTAATTYVGSAKKVSDEGNGTQQVQRISQNDAFGRLASICEVSSQTQAGSGGAPGPCGQVIGATGFLTSYTYNVVNDLTAVSQAGYRIRTFTYDALSHLLCASSPEVSTATCPSPDSGTYTPGTVRYGYDPVGNLSLKVSPKPNQTTPSVTVTATYKHDPLRRLTQKSFDDGTTPTANFVYDVSQIDGHSNLQNTIWRTVRSDVGSNAAADSDYDPMGRLLHEWQCTPQNCGTSSFPILFAHDLLGNLTSETNGVGTTITYGYNTAGRLTGATSSLSDSNHPGTLLSGLLYNAFSLPVADSLGNGVSESFSYTQRGALQTVSAKTANAPMSPGTGSSSVSGSEQSRSISAVAGTGTVSIGSGDRSVTINPCTPYSCPQTYYDYGTISVTVNGFTASTTYDQSSYVGLIASSLTSALNGASSPVTASVSNGIITLTTKATGSASNYSLSAISQTNDPSHFSGGSFTPTPSGSTLTGGSNAYTLYDTGSVWITVNGFQASTSYGQSSTSSTLASALASVLNGPASPVIASASGSSITLTSNIAGANTNYPVSSGSSTSLPGSFSPSFAVSLSGSNLTGGSGGLYSLDLVHAGNGDIQTAFDSINGTWVYTYDSFNRLSTANQNSGQAVYSYGYDRFGNRWNQNGPHTMVLTFSGDTNRMDGYSYDAAGNLRSDGIHSYAYDAENRIITVDGGATASYIYDADGRRVRKTTSIGSVDYLYDSEAHVIAEVDSSGGWKRGEVYVAGRHLATYNYSSTYFIHADQLGTERARSNLSGTIAQSCTSLPFGDWLGCSGTDASPIHFTGKEHDTESGLENFGARYYAATFGRFVTVDRGASPTPLQFARADMPQSLNLYAYVENNPINSIDTDGHGDDIPLPGFGKYTIRLDKNNPGDYPNIHVKKSGIDVAKVRFNPDGTTQVVKGSLSGELEEAVWKEGVKRDFFGAARLRKAEFVARGTPEDQAPGGGTEWSTTQNALAVLQFAQIIVDAYLDSRDAPEMDKKYGYHLWSGLVIVTNAGLAAKNLPEGSALWVGGVKFTLHNGKWTNDQGWTLYMMNGQIYVCPPQMSCTL